MFKAYASSDKEKEEEKKVIVTSSTTASTNNTTTNESKWLENQSFSIEAPAVTLPQPKSIQVVDVKPKTDEKKPIAKPAQTTAATVKKTDANTEVFYVDRRRDRANITVQYTTGIPRYGNKFCNQHPLGSRIFKPRKQRIIRYFHQKLDDIDNRPLDPFVTVDQRLEQLNTAIREHPQSFDAWKELIDYQYYLFKTNGEQEKLTALFNKQLSIIDRASELNSNRLQYRLLRLIIRTQSRLFNSEILLKEWSTLIKDCLKSSDDRTIIETWSAYIQFLLTHIEVFSIDKFNDIFKEYLSTYTYHIQTRSERGQRFLLNHMIDMLQIWMYILREAGFTERALGIYQTMLELHLGTSGGDFVQRLNEIEENWSKKSVHFGEECQIENPVQYLEQELSLLSQTENHLFNSTFQSWLSIEQLRINFYQSKVLNHAIHFHSDLLRSLTDTSQIDHEISNSRLIRPYVFQIKDQRQIIQLIFYYLHFLNGLPQSSIIHEISNRLKISLSNQFHEQLIIEQEFRLLSQFLNPNEILRTEERFSMEYISKVYEQLISNPSLKSYQIDFILLYWYYLAENLLELRSQSTPSSPLSKTRAKSLQNIIKKYLALEEYRTCLRLYTHYARLEYEYFQRVTDGRRIFDLCFQTIRTNPTNFSTFDSYTDLCHWLSTSLICEFRLNGLFDQMLKMILDNVKHVPIDQQIHREKLCAWIKYVLNQLFPEMPFNDIITLVIQCLKSPKISKWDQKSEKDWSIYLRQNNFLSFELLFIFLSYSYLLDHPFEKLQQIICTSILPLINEQRNKNNQSLIDYLLQFHVTILWNELFTERLLFNQCTDYLKQLLDGIQWPSIILFKFTSFYTCLLPLYGSYAKEFEGLVMSYRYNQKIEYRLMTKMIVLQMNFIRHLKIQKANSVNEKFNSGYEHRVRRILRQLIQDYPFYLPLWKFYESFETSSPNNNRLKGVLYDAIQNCPWAKSFYLKSICNASDETEWKLFLNVMLKSNVHILFSFEEFEMFKELFEMKS